MITHILYAAAQPAATSDGVSYELLLTLLAVEATFCVLTWAAFNAESRLQRERDADIRDAEAGYDAGQVVPAIAQFIEGVLAVRRGDEPIQSTLDRADTAGPLRGVIDAATASGRPREIEQRLIKAWTVSGVAGLCVQVSGPVLLLNEIANDELLSQATRVAAGIVLSGSAAVLAVSLVVVRHLARSLTRAIRGGKDAGGGS